MSLIEKELAMEFDDDLTVAGRITGTGGLALAPVLVTDASTYTLLAANSGKLHVMQDLTADCTISTPTPEAGLVFEFIYGGAAADAQDWIIDTGDDNNYFVGGVVQHDPDTAGDDTAVYRSDGDSNSILSILTPDVGTYIKLVCNGTVWYVNGTAVTATDIGVTFADQA